MAIKRYNTKDQPQRCTATLIYGPPKVGKTTCAGTWPNPVFVVPAQERGTSSLHAAGKGVDILEVASISDMSEALQVVRAEYEKHNWRTVVFDPWTTYTLIAEVEMREIYTGRDYRQMYGELRQHQLNVWRAMQGLPLHTVWVCHETGDTEELGGCRTPLAVGSAIKALMASVDINAYMTKRTKAIRTEDGEIARDDKGRPMKQEQRMLITQEFPEEVFGFDFVANARWNERLSEGVYKPHWSVFAKRLKDVVRID